MKEWLQSKIIMVWSSRKRVPGPVDVKSLRLMEASKKATLENMEWGDTKEIDYNLLHIHHHDKLLNTPVNDIATSHVLFSTLQTPTVFK